MDFEVRMKLIRNQLETYSELNAYWEGLVSQNDSEILQLQDEVSKLTQKALNGNQDSKLLEAYYWRVECLKRDRIFIEQAQREIERLREQVIWVYLDRTRF